MRKWTYLVAALLMAGATTTFTGCIDNDEPAGITDLRGAKAELIRANAAYKLAETEIRKVDIERQKVLLEREKLDMEMQKLDLKIKEAQTAHDVAYWEQQKALMIEDYKAKLFQYQAASANWEAEYLKALAELRVVQATITDKTFAKELGDLIGKLEGERSNIKGLNNELFDLTQSLLAFSSGKYAAIKGVAEKDLKNKESKLVNQTAILEEVKSLKADFGTEAINAQILELEKKIAKIDEEVAAKKAELIKVIGTATEPQQLYSRQKVALETADKVITFEVPAAIQDKFITDFINNSTYSSLKNLVPTDGWDGFVANVIKKGGKLTFKTNPAVNGLALGSVTPYNEVLPTTLLSTQVTDFATDVKVAGVRSYASAYEYVNNGFKYGLGNLSKNAATITELTADDLAKGTAALAQVGKDVTTAQTTYDADVKAFEDAVKAYQKDAEAYGIGLQLKDDQEAIVETAWDAYQDAKTIYNQALANNSSVATKKTAYDNAKKDYEGLLKDMNATQQQIKEAKEKMDDAKAEYDEAAKVLATPAAELAAAYKALQTKLATYYPLRKNLCGDTDGLVATVVGFNEGKEFKFVDKIASLTEEQFASASTRGLATVIGVAYTTYDNTSDKTGSLQTWLKASAKLYGSVAGTIAGSKQIVQDLASIEPNTDVSVSPIAMGSAMTLVTLKNAKDAFANIDSWKTLTATIEGLATASSTKEAPIVAEIKKQADAIKGIYEPYRDTFYALCALDNTMFNDAALTAVKNALNITSAPNDKGEKQTLSELRDALKDHVNNNSVTIYIPVYKNDKLEEDTPITTIALTEAELNSAIDKIEKNIGHLEVYIAAKKDELKKLEDGTLKIDEFIANEKVKVENEIAFKEEQIKNAQERFDALNKAKDALIKEFAGTDK